VHKGSLINISLETARITRCITYLKGYCLYLFRENDRKLIEVMYIKSFFASKIAGAGVYSFGLELVNAGFGILKKYYFYSDKEAEIDNWIKIINTSNDFFKFKMQYEVFEEIGKGHFSIVNRCIKRNTEAEYVVKRIEKQKLNTKERDLLQNEMAIVPVLDHMFIPQYITVSEDNIYIYIVMERIKGITLQEYITKRKCLPEIEASFILYILLKAISYIHNIGIIHRDLKPCNILVELNEEQSAVMVKLIDFGFSVIAEPDEKLLDPCGAPAYVAPEILKQEGYNKEVDMWSLGIIAYLMYC